MLDEPWSLRSTTRANKLALTINLLFKQAGIGRNGKSELDIIETPRWTGFARDPKRMYPQPLNFFATRLTIHLSPFLQRPRTSPTLSASPTSSPKSTPVSANTSPTTNTTNCISPTTMVMKRVPSPSAIGLAAVVSSNPRLRSAGQVRTSGLQGVGVAGDSGTRVASLGMSGGPMGGGVGLGAGGARSSPLVESFTPSGLGLSIPSGTNVNNHKKPIAPGPSVSGVAKSIRSSAAQCQAVLDGRGGTEEKSKKPNQGIIINNTAITAAATSLTSAPSSSSACNDYFSSSHSSPLGLSLRDLDHFNFGVGKGICFDRTDLSGGVEPAIHESPVEHRSDRPHKARDSSNNNTGIRDFEPEQFGQLSLADAESRSQVSRTQTQRQQQQRHLTNVPNRIPYSDSSVHPYSDPFVDVPFPLHPEKTFRLHTSPLVGSPLMNSSTVSMKTPSSPSSSLSSSQFDVAPPPSSRPPAASSLASALPASISCPSSFPSASTSRSCSRADGEPGSVLGSVKSARELSSVLSTNFSSPFSVAAEAALSSPSAPTATTQRKGSTVEPEPMLSPNAQRRMRAFINEDMYNSPPSPSSTSSRYSTSPTQRSPSSVMLLSSRVQWLRRSERGDDEGDDDDSRLRESNYSTLCSPSSTPLFYRRATSKIETVLGPRERGIDCVPEKRDYQCSYSKLKMSPSSLTPLEEDKSLDLSTFMDVVGSKKDSSQDTRFEGYSSSGSSNGTVSGNLRDVSSQPLSGLPVTTSPTFVSGTNRDAFGSSGSGAKAVVNTRVGLRRKVTGVSSPLANCVATWESISDKSPLQEDEAGAGVGDGEDCETPMSPLLMRAKDSLLLRDVQRRKKRRVITPSVTEEVEESSAVQPIGAIEGMPVSASAPSRVKWGSLLEADYHAPSSPEATETESLLLDSNEASDFLALTPLTLATQIRLPETPTIGPSTRTASGSRELDEAISPLQLSSPTFPLTAVVRETAWVKAPLAASVSFDLGMLGKHQRACA
ncbi:hypothetical protein NP233_g2777 [Leucocoprinus birnbaumii]|uniref:Uncharacterized protein n=1 Tax=Leucocoprinus birnbaumii TaxID=56174 RepID=A0AAD5VY98_9AGAR|nr:hypothetical protein NP233_g2777 [Leucocoprinus birnbaumii]